MSTIFALLALGAVELLIVTLYLAFWIWMIVDCAQSGATQTTKIIWLLVILFSGIGALLYFFLYKLPRKSSTPPAPHA
jgi:hypothetical protein